MLSKLYIVVQTSDKEDEEMNWFFEQIRKENKKFCDLIRNSVHNMLHYPYVTATKIFKQQREQAANQLKSMKVESQTRGKENIISTLTEESNLVEILANAQKKQEQRITSLLAAEEEKTEIYMKESKTLK